LEEQQHLLQIEVATKQGGTKFFKIIKEKKRAWDIW